MADCDDGYTRFANELLEALIDADLTKRQYKVMLAVIRKTYGFNKKLDWVSNPQLSKMTNIHETHCSAEKVELVRMGLLVQQGRKVGPNPDLSGWKIHLSQDSEALAKPAKNSLAETAKAPQPKRLNTKDNQTKETKNKDQKSGAQTCTAAKPSKAKPSQSKPSQSKPSKAKASQSKPSQPKRFIKPTQEQILAYMTERGRPCASEAERFFDYYQSNGWRVGRNPMKDWKAAIRNWLKGSSRRPSSQPSVFRPSQQVYQGGDL